MTRYPALTPNEMYGEQRRVANAVQRRRKPSVSSKGGLEGPFAVLLYVPEILDRIQHLGEYCRFSTDVEPKLRELAIIIAARQVGQPLEFRVHAMEAREFGLAEDIIDAIAANRRPDKLADDEEVVYDFCWQMLSNGNVSDAIYARAEALLGRKAIVELVVTCGYYKTLGLVFNVSLWKPAVQPALPFAAEED